MTDERRKDFEEWAKAKGWTSLELDSYGYSYENSWVRKAWEGYQAALDSTQAQVDGNTSDGYHTFNELYEHRHALFALLADWKSRLHSDGTMFDGWFIAGKDTPYGQITYHIPDRLWELYAVAELDKAPQWDGHTSSDVIERLHALSTTQPREDAC